MSLFRTWMAQAEGCQYVLAEDEAPSRHTRVPWVQRCPGCGERHGFDLVVFGGQASE